MFPPLLVCAATGDTAATCGSGRSTSAILTDTGEPPRPARKDDPGGLRRMSAPVPAVRILLSFKIPSERPTISRISVTSTAMATMLINDRIGRCTRLERIIFFIGVPRIDLRAWGVRVLLFLLFFRTCRGHLLFTLQIEGRRFRR